MEDKKQVQQDDKQSPTRTLVAGAVVAIAVGTIAAWAVGRRSKVVKPEEDDQPNSDKKEK